MLNKCVLALLLCIQAPVYSQNPWFNLLLDYGYQANHFRDIAVVSDTIIGLGMGYANDSNLAQGILVARLDSSGHPIDHKLFLDSLGGHLFVATSSGNKIIGTSDGGYAFVAASYDRNDAYLYKLNNQLDIEFIRIFQDTVYLSNFPYSLLETPTGYLLYGYNSNSNYEIFSFLQHVDKQGNVQWRKQYAYNGVDNFLTDAEMLNDSIFVASTWINVDGSKAKYRSSLRKMHVNGTQLGYWESATDAETGAILEILALPDGGIITHGHSFHSLTFSSVKVQQTHCRFDSNFQLKWIRHWHRIDYVHRIRNVKDMIAAGVNKVVSIGDGVYYITPLEPDRTANIGAFTINGDSLWHREVYPPYPPNSFDGKAIYGGGLLTSGSIVAGGEGRIGAAYYAWLLKISKDGCLDTLFDCLPVSSTTSGWVDNKEESVTISPNPSTQFVQLHFSPTQQTAQLRLYHLTGQEIQHRTVWMGDGTADLWVGDYPPGVYMVVLEQRDGQRWAGRLVVQ